MEGVEIEQKRIGTVVFGNSNVADINFCSSSFQTLYPYQVVGSFFYYLEKKSAT